MPNSVASSRPELPQGDDGDTSHSEDASTVSPDETSWTRLGEDAALRSMRSMRSSVASISSTDVKAEDIPGGLSCCAWLGMRLNACVLVEDSQIRKLYEVILAALLFYTGTVFPYQLCFLEFAIPTGVSPPDLLQVVDRMVDVLFLLDLFIGFFVSVRDNRDLEVVQFSQIARTYMKGYFWANLVACIPVSLIMEMIQKDQGDDDGGVGSMAELTRFQRISRLGRLVRLLRLVKFVPLMASRGLMRRLRRSRTARILNFVIYLFWAVHLLACGYHLCAWFHRNQTWYDRRELTDGRTLVEEPPFVQWLHTMYFLFAVFTSVGFGDIHARSVGEITYVFAAMLMGAMLNGIIMSELINVLSTLDQHAADVKRHKALISSFAEHVNMDPWALEQLHRALDSTANRRNHWEVKKDEVHKLMTGGLLPEHVAIQMPQFVYGGRLLCNRFVYTCTIFTGKLIPRFPLQLALLVSKVEYLETEMVCSAHEHAWEVYLVHTGTFAAIARPSPDGGLAEPPMLVSQAAGEIAQRGVQGRRRRMMFAQRPVGVQSGSRSGGGETSQSQAECSKASRQQSSMLSTSLSLLRKSATTTARIAMKTQKTNMSASSSSESLMVTKMHPYKLYGPGYYFGEADLLLERARSFSVRCESQKGVLLTLEKPHLLRLMEDFPEYGTVWRLLAPRQEMRRLRALKRLTRGQGYKSLAASTIQRRVRRFLTRTVAQRRNSRDSLKMQASQEMNAPKAESVWVNAVLNLAGRRYSTSSHQTSMELGPVPSPDGDTGDMDPAVAASLASQMHSDMDEISAELAGIRSEIGLLASAVAALPRFSSV